LALFGHDAMSELSLLSDVERKLDFGVVRSVDDPTETTGTFGEGRSAPIG
jgi:hypothetical protein